MKYTTPYAKVVAFVGGWWGCTWFIPAEDADLIP